MLKRRTFRDGAEEEKKEKVEEKEFESELEKLLGPEKEEKIVVEPEDLEPEKPPIEIKPEDLKPEKEKIVVEPDLEPEEEEVIKVEPEKPLFKVPDRREGYKPSLKKPERPPYKPPPPEKEKEEVPEEEEAWYYRWWVLAPLSVLGMILAVILATTLIMHDWGGGPETVSIKMVTPVDGSTVERIREVVFESSKKVDLGKINVEVLKGQERISGTTGGMADRQFFWDCGTDKLPEGPYTVSVTVKETKVEPPAEFSFTIGEEKRKEPEITPSADPLDRYRDKTQVPAEDPLDRYR